MDPMNTYEYARLSQIGMHPTMAGYENYLWIAGWGEDLGTSRPGCHFLPYIRA